MRQDIAATGTVGHHVSYLYTFTAMLKGRNIFFFLMDGSQQSRKYNILHMRACINACVCEYNMVEFMHFEFKREFTSLHHSMTNTSLLFMTHSFTEQTYQHTIDHGEVCRLFWVTESWLLPRHTDVEVFVLNKGKAGVSNIWSLEHHGIAAQQLRLMNYSRRLIVSQVGNGRIHWAHLHGSHA